MRTPTDGAAIVVARFPQGQLLVVPGVGHDTIDADFSGCAAQRRPLVDARRDRRRHVPAHAAACPAIACPSRRRARKPATPPRRAATYSIATKTIADARGDVAGSASRASAVPGVFGGKLTPGQRQFTLTRYAFAPRRDLSGSSSSPTTRFPLSFQGTLTVDRPTAATGLLGLKGTSLRGTLGGRIVGRAKAGPLGNSAENGGHLRALHDHRDRPADDPALRRPRDPEDARCDPVRDDVRGRDDPLAGQRRGAEHGTACIGPACRSR